ncbi:hypothetical protein [Enterobacter cloacae complex sp. 2024EL-00214]
MRFGAKNFAALHDGKHCQATLTVDANPEHKLKTYGPLVCREQP